MMVFVCKLRHPLTRRATLFGISKVRRTLAHVCHLRDATICGIPLDYLQVAALMDRSQS